MMPEAVDPFSTPVETDFGGESSETDDEGSDICHEDDIKEEETDDA